MANAKMCDKCKKLYLPYNGETIAKRVKMDTCNGFSFVYLNYKGVGEMSKLFDLCPDCLKQLTDWFLVGFADSEGEN